MLILPPEARACLLDDSYLWIFWLKLFTVRNNRISGGGGGLENASSLKLEMMHGP